MDDRVMSIIKDFTILTDTVKINFKNLEDEMTLLKRAIITHFEQIEGAVSKIKVHESKSFNGSRNSKELENSL